MFLTIYRVEKSQCVRSKDLDNILEDLDEFLVFCQIYCDVHSSNLVSSTAIASFSN